MNERRIARELIAVAREILAFDVPLVALLDDRDKVIKRRGKAIEGVGIFDSAGRDYPAGFDKKGELYAAEVASDDSVLLAGGKKSQYKVGERYPEAI